MPADMEFMDIRKGSDVEFGQSIYEPFGIAQVEPISFGGICVYTERLRLRRLRRTRRRRKAHAERDRRGLHRPAANPSMRPEQLLAIGQPQRDAIENRVAGTGRQRTARPPARARPEDSSRSSSAATHLAQKMSWDVVARDYVLPGIQRATRASRLEQIA